MQEQLQKQLNSTNKNNQLKTEKEKNPFPKI